MIRGQFLSWAPHGILISAWAGSPFASTAFVLATQNSRASFHSAKRRHKQKPNKDKKQENIMTDTTPTAHFTPLGKDGFAYLPLAATTSIPTDDWTPEIDYDVRDAAYSWWM